MQKIFIAIIFVVCQLISYSALALTVSSPPIYQVKASDFIEKFNILNKQYRYNLKPIKKSEESLSEYDLAPHINLTMHRNSWDELITQLKLNCDQSSNNKSADMNKCQQSIQLISEAFDADFELSDFERNKVCESKHKTSWPAGSSGMVKLCSYEFNNVRYTQEHDLDDQSLRFIISPFLGNIPSKYLRIR
ncbi:hypothetical protein DKK71_10645 [Snodgrassella alvi]|uniref:hypothetical protein n=1 Tax=Snodgrassella alvi TaxID=1196083 RepID=UPI000D78995D|nr:hypothetical protein [Snodgrassella alvi]PXY95746.1 hypothetical protein DKK71_10645 [Snodgrassella alvi]